MGGTDNNLMGLSFGAEGILGLSNAFSQSRSQSSQAEYEKQAFETNVKLSEIQADDAIRKGDREASQYKKKVKGTIGAQRAAYAAQGIDVGTGSASEIQEDTAAVGAENELMIKNNAWREAFGYRVQANEYATKAKFTKLAGDAASRSTLVTGGLNALSYGMKAGYAFSGGGKTAPPPKKLTALSALDHMNIYNGEDN